MQARRALRWLSIGLGLSLAFSARVAAALDTGQVHSDVATEGPSPEPHRELGRHRFPIAAFVPTALTLGHFGIRAGIEYHSVPGFTRNLSFFDSEVESVELQTINAAETADFAIRLHDVIALVGDAYGLARVGANTPTLLGSGADYTYGGNVGVLVKLLRAGGFQLAVRATVGYYAGQQAGIVGLFNDIGDIVKLAISDIPNDPTLPLRTRLDRLDSEFRKATAELITPFRGSQYGGSLNAAQALGRYLGLQLSLGLFGDFSSYDLRVYDPLSESVGIVVRSVDKLWPRFAAALDIDGAPAHFPVDLLLEYVLTPLEVETRMQGEVAQQASLTHLLAVGLYYSGRVDLQLGATAYVLIGQVPARGANAMPSGEPLDVGGQFVFKYLW